MSLTVESISVKNRGETGRAVLPSTARTNAELADVYIINLDCALRVCEVHSDFLAQLGQSAADVYGRHFADFVHPGVRQAALQQLSRLGEGRRDRVNARLAWVRANGAAFAADVTGVAVRGDNGRVSTIVLMVRPDRIAESPRVTADRRKLLSELDARVLEGVAAGISTVQLASKLYLSRQGIEYHVGAMLRRFKSPNRSALVAKAYSQGILCIGHWPPKVTPEYIR